MLISTESSHLGNIKFNPLSFPYDECSPKSLTHGIFRYPAKFHPGVARALLRRFAQGSECVYDPFCGSGTLLVEAANSGVKSIGSDVDALAAFIALAKSTRIDPARLARDLSRVWQRVSRYEGKRDYDALAMDDLSVACYESEAAPLRKYVPKIPQINHWFRRYVIVDLARIRRAIELCEISASSRRIATLCFASIIRNASNADPVPVSGLEYTAHMRKLDELGRIVDPFDLLARKFEEALDGYATFASGNSPTATTRTFVADARRIRAGRFRTRLPDTIITSPPYLGSVDYYRRHQLELFWLGFVEDGEQRASEISGYIGRPKIYGKAIENPHSSPVLERFLSRLSEEKPMLRRSALHYFSSMRQVFAAMAKLLPFNASAIFVIGQSTIGGVELPIIELFEDIASPAFSLVEIDWFQTKNRYMSYTRHNGADIRRELILHFKRV